MASKEVVEITESNFEAEVLNSEVPVLVDFWAPWCRPCLALTPVIEQLADEYKGKLKVAKINTDANQRLAVQYGISSIPAVFIFKGGQVVDRAVGARPKAAFVSFVSPHIA